MLIHEPSPRSQPTVAACELPAEFAARYPILSVHWPGLPTAAHDVRLSRLARHVYKLGPRAILQVLREIVAAHAIADDVIAKLETYTALDPVTVALVGRRHIPEPPPIHSVRA